VKQLLLYSLLSFSAFSQTDTIRIQKIQNFYPSIAGIQSGEIPFWKLCASEGLETKTKSHIISFDLQYFGKRGLIEQHIAGNHIPDSVCIQIGAYGLDNMIFFTNIRAILPDSGKLLHLSSMNLIPVKKDE